MTENINELKNILISDKSNIRDKHRALFTLKNLKNLDALKIMIKGLNDKSVLLQNEIAYVIGQMGMPYAIPFLSDILKDPSQAPMVRHECAEALGAIGNISAIPILKEFVHCNEQIVADSCFLAIKRIEDIQKKNIDSTEIERSHDAFSSIDPAFPKKEVKSIIELKQLLMNQTACLYERYKAMFALRNVNIDESILALCNALEDPNPLFQHEIAFVLGQLQNPLSIPALKKVLRNHNMPSISRHECAEALGAIATKEAVNILIDHLNDKDLVVRESCQVALDISEHENSDNLHYLPSNLKILKESKL